MIYYIIYIDTLDDLTLNRTKEYITEGADVIDAIYNFENATNLDSRHILKVHNYDFHRARSLRFAENNNSKLNFTNN
mgnify:FL=1